MHEPALAQPALRGSAARAVRAATGRPGRPEPLRSVHDAVAAGRSSAAGATVDRLVRAGRRSPWIRRTTSRSCGAPRTRAARPRALRTLATALSTSCTAGFACQIAAPTRAAAKLLSSRSLASALTAATARPTSSVAGADREHAAVARSRWPPAPRPLIALREEPSASSPGRRSPAVVLSPTREARPDPEVWAQSSPSGLGALAAARPRRRCVYESYARTSPRSRTGTSPRSACA